MAIREQMNGYERAGSLTLAALLVMIIFSPITVQSQDTQTCCTGNEFNLFLLGESDGGILSPFYSDLEEDPQEKIVTSSIGGEVKIGNWQVIWGIEGEYSADTWNFAIPYELEQASGFTVNATLEVKVGDNTYEGALDMPDVLLTGVGELEVSVEVGQESLSEGDKIELTLTVQNLIFTSPGEETGVRFLWGSEQYSAHISVKLPLLEITMKEASVIGELAYFPIMINSGFEDRIWSSSEGNAKIQNVQISESPIAILRENGVEVTFVWNIPDNSDVNNIRFDFELIPQPGLIIETNRTHEIVTGEDGPISDWYPEDEPLRNGGAEIEVGIDASFKGNLVEKQISIEFDGAMSQWMRWGLDNIGNNSLDSNSWWKNLNSYSDSVKSSEKHNGRVDDSEILAMQNHLIGSKSDLKSFFANGLYLDIESIIGVNPIELGPTKIDINMGKTRAFSSEEIIITIDTSYRVQEGQRQLLVENFIRPSADKYWTGISLNIGIKTNMLTGIGEIYADEIDYELRRWVIMESLKIGENDIDEELEFKLEFVPPSSIFFSPLVSAMASVFALCVALIMGLALTKRRARLPTMVTVLVLGALAFTIYWMGLPLQIVLGIVSTSILLVFPISLVSPSSGTMEKISKKIGGPHVKCPSCGKSNKVESTIRPLRIPCSDCNSILRIE